MRHRTFCVTLLCLSAGWSTAAAEDMQVSSRLHVLLSKDQLKTILPLDSHALIEPSSIERLLDELDGHPPDWQTIYGHGHHDPGHDDRLFALNRERDAQREGKPALSWLVTFAWSGRLGPYHPEDRGFPVAVGPNFTPTRWGIVRFKPEETPGNLTVTADEPQREALAREIAEQGPIDIIVLMTGRLISQESLVYDFSHEEEGRGLIMPFVRVESVQFVRLNDN
jgi:hypothetical protein